MIIHNIFGMLIFFFSIYSVILMGCGSVAKVRMFYPATHSLGSANQLVLVQSTGKRSIREIIEVELAKQSRQTAWWQFSDRQSEGIEIKLKGDMGAAEGGQPEKGQIFLRIDVYECRADSVSEEKKIIQKDGNKKTIIEEFYIGEASFGVTTLDRKGRAVLSEKEYMGKSKDYVKDGKDKNIAKHNAIADAIANLIKDVSPKYKTDRIKLDDKEEDLKPIIMTINNGNYADAEAMLEQMMRTFPNRPDVNYNLAVVKDAMGEFERAIALYDKAISLGGKDFYMKSRTSCATRVAARRALSN